MPRTLFFLFVPLLLAGVTEAQGASLSITPHEIKQGEPALVTLDGVSPHDLQSLSFGVKDVPVFEWKGKPSALVAVGLNARTGIALLTAKTAGGGKVQKEVRIVPRVRIEAPMGIPQKMGGNTPAGANTLVNALARENDLLSHIVVSDAPRFLGAFRYPLADITVTDNFGYSRKTGAYTIYHRGTDFAASLRTPVYATNDGVVRFAGNLLAYGKIVIIDHGARVASYSLHLDRMDVREGEVVKRGQVIGLSGDTGYALEPHLHFSVKVGGISVDPVAFFRLLGEKGVNSAPR